MSAETPRNKNSYRYFKIERAQDAVVACIVDSHLVGSISEFLELEFRQLLTSPDFRILVIDFENVKMISTSSIQALLYARNRSLAAGVNIRLASMTPSVRYVFETLKFVGTVFRVYDSTAEALNEPEPPTFLDKHGRLYPAHEDDET